MNIIIAIIAISVLVLVHELGHYLAARISGVWVEEFGIGLPPRLWGKKIGGTLYSVNALPIGGFVRLHGEELGMEVSDPDRAFKNKSKKARIFITSSGVFMNFLMAALALSVISWYYGVSRGVKVLSVAPESPAEVVGIMEGDEILSVNGEKMILTDRFGVSIYENKGKKVDLRVKNGDEVRNIEVVLRSEVPEGEGLLGVIYQPVEIYQPPLLTRPFVHFYYGTLATYGLSKDILFGFTSLIVSLGGGKIPKGVAGPVGVAAIVSEAAKIGFLPFLQFMAMISVNLAVLNLIPFPPLDGFRIAMVGVEGVFGKRLLPKAEAYIQIGGMAILIGLLVLLTLNDIPNIIRAGGIEGFVNSLVY